VSRGWFTCAGDAAGIRSQPSRLLWVDDFVVQRHSVSHGDFIVFLEDLVAQGREEEALEHVPRQVAGSFGGRGPMIYGRTPDNGFCLVPDNDGDLWGEGWPVMMIRASGAEAYARWFAERTGRPWRLLSEWEYEKAARGVDGRFFPWGDIIDPSWCAHRESFETLAPLPVTKELFEGDVSPYGVRSMAGGMRCFTGSVYTVAIAGSDGDRMLVPGPLPEGASRTVRGGAFNLASQFCRVAFRNGSEPGDRFEYTGFRLAFSI